MGTPDEGDSNGPSDAAAGACMDSGAPDEVDEVKVNPLAEFLPWGQLLRQLRKKRGWSQETLAEMAGIKKDTIGSIERASRKPHWASVSAMGVALGMTTTRLMRLRSLFDRCEKAYNRARTESQGSTTSREDRSDGEQNAVAVESKQALVGSGHAHGMTAPPATTIEEQVSDPPTMKDGGTVAPNTASEDARLAQEAPRVPLPELRPERAVVDETPLQRKEGMIAETDEDPERQPPGEPPLAGAGRVAQSSVPSGPYVAMAAICLAVIGAFPIWAYRTGNSDGSVNVAGSWPDLRAAWSGVVVAAGLSLFLVSLIGYLRRSTVRVDIASGSLMLAAELLLIAYLFPVAAQWCTYLATGIIVVAVLGQAAGEVFARVAGHPAGWTEPLHPLPLLLSFAYTSGVIAAFHLLSPALDNMIVPLVATVITCSLVMVGLWVRSLNLAWYTWLGTLGLGVVCGIVGLVGVIGDHLGWDAALFLVAFALLSVPVGYGAMALCLSADPRLDEAYRRNVTATAQEPSQ